MVPVVAAASCTKACARGPWVGGTNGAWPVTTVVHVVAVCVSCCGRPLSRAGWPAPFASAGFGSCPTIASEVGTGSVLVRLIVSPVVLTPAVAVYGTRISGGCHTVLGAVVPADCAPRLVCLQVAPPLAAAVPVPPAVVAAGLPHSQPHIGTMLPSGINAVWRSAVRLTTDCAQAVPAVSKRADPARIAVVKVFLVIRMFLLLALTAFRRCTRRRDRPASSSACRPERRRRW